MLVLGLLVFWAQQAGLLDFDRVEVFVEQLGSWAPLLYAIAYILLGMAGLTKVGMTVLAGALFNFYLAMGITVFASTVAAVLGFYLARNFKDFIQEKLMKPEGSANKFSLSNATRKIQEGAEKNGFYVVSILRLSFVPLMFLSYTSGLVENLRIREFFWAIFLTNIFVNFVYIFIGASLRESLPMFMLAIAVLLVFMQTPRIIKKVTDRNRWKTG